MSRVKHHVIDKDGQKRRTCRVVWHLFPRFGCICCCRNGGCPHKCDYDSRAIDGKKGNYKMFRKKKNPACSWKNNCSLTLFFCEAQLVSLLLSFLLLFSLLLAVNASIVRRGGQYGCVFNRLKIHNMFPYVRNVTQ